MREHADMIHRPDADGIPSELRRWLKSRGLTMAQWRADPRFKATGKITPSPKLAVARRRQALVESLRR